MINATGSPAELPTFELDGERFLQPDFGGRGLANVAPTILRLLAAEALQDSLPPSLDASVLPQRLTEGVRCVVLLVADGLGHQQLLREIAAGNAPRLGELLGRAAAGDERVAYTPITSVFPTTTVAALGSLNSGVTPAQHGLLGYTLYLPELGMVGEMIRWGPLNRRISFADPEFGCSPEQFFWSETLYQRLAEAGVSRGFAVNPAAFAGTALTRMLHQGATYAGYIATSSVMPIVHRLLDQNGREPTYIYAYWPTIDTIAHIVGPQTAEHSAEVANFDGALGRLLDRLGERDGTLVLLTADHGHVETDPDHQISLAEHPELLDMLMAPPAGERRAVYLHPRPGAAEAVVAYARERLRPVAAVATREEVLQLGIFGPRPLSQRAAERIGDVLLFPRGKLQLVAPIEPSPVGPHLPPPPLFRGLHGGLTAAEALVPLLALRV